MQHINILLINSHCGINFNNIFCAFYLQHKCDLINMSYGEPTMLPDYGRFVDLVNEVLAPKIEI